MLKSKQNKQYNFSLNKRKLLFVVIACALIITMISLFSLNKKQSLLPSDRFSFMQQNEQEAFIKDIQGYFQSKPNFKLDFSQGVVYRENNMEYGLDNLAQTYHQANVDDRKKIIADHFNGIFHGQQEQEKILMDISNFDLAKKYLAVRLYPPDYAQQVGKSFLVYREDLDGVLTVLVLDLPSTITNVKPEQAAKWKISTEKLFDIGLENTFANNKVE